MTRPGRPRVLVVGCQWPPQTFLRQLFVGLSRDVEVVIASRTAFRDEDLRRLALVPESWPRPLRAAKTLVDGLPALRRAEGRRLLAIGGLRRLPYLRRRVDVLYFPWNYGAIAHLPLMRLGIPSIVSCRGAQIQVAPHQPERRRETARLGASLEAATRVHCVSEAMVEQARRFGLDPRKARVIRPAVDTEFFTPPDSRSAGPPWRLMAAGSLIWRKGFEDALLALRGLVGRGFDVHLDLVGDGVDRPRLDFAVDDLGLRDRVTMHGRVSRERVRELLRRAHVFVLPSLSEGLANVVLEAMACGVPVVSTECGGMREAIEDGANGLLVPPQDPAALEEAITTLLGDETRRRRFREAALSRIEEHYRLDRQVEQFTKLIFDAISCNA